MCWVRCGVTGSVVAALRFAATSGCRSRAQTDPTARGAKGRRSWGPVRPPRCAVAGPGSRCYVVMSGLNRCIRVLSADFSVGGQVHGSILGLRIFAIIQARK
jgi:hypothetical protein